MSYRSGGPSRTSTTEHRRWARTVLARDHYRCAQCGYQGAPRKSDVQADHIEPVYAGGAELDPDNGQTLCLSCHRIKSQTESAAARRAKASRGRIKPEPHPGLCR